MHFYWREVVYGVDWGRAPIRQSHHKQLPETSQNRAKRTQCVCAVCCDRLAVGFYSSDQGLSVPKSWQHSLEVSLALLQHYFFSSFRCQARWRIRYVSDFWIKIKKYLIINVVYIIKVFRYYLRYAVVSVHVWKISVISEMCPAKFVHVGIGFPR